MWARTRHHGEVRMPRWGTARALPPVGSAVEGAGPVRRRAGGASRVAWGTAGAVRRHARRGGGHTPLLLTRPLLLLCSSRRCWLGRLGAAVDPEVHREQRARADDRFARARHDRAVVPEHHHEIARDRTRPHDSSFAVSLRCSRPMTASLRCGASEILTGRAVPPSPPVPEDEPVRLWRERRARAVLAREGG